MARRRHTKRRAHRRRQQQRGGGWGFDGPAFAPAGGMAPESARALTDDCAVPLRPAPAVTPTGAWSQAGGGCGCSVGPMPPQAGGWLPAWLGGSSSSDADAEEEEEKTDGDISVAGMNAASTMPTNAQGGAAVPVQSGGGGGGGGYGFALDNAMGKVYSDLPVGPCPSQRGGAAPTVSYPAGYGFAPASAIEEGGGSAHFLAPISYGKQCMGGGRRATRGRGRRATRGKRGRQTRRQH
jgi:hypothetical protein